MNTLRNSVRLIGNVGVNPEIRSFDGNRKLAKFSLATTEVYKDPDGEKTTRTQWHNIVAWGKTAEISERLLRKGCEVAVEGKLLTRQYEDKNGITRYITEIQVNEILLMRGRS